MSEQAHIIAVWGSPGSGKTTFATKLATAIYDQYQSSVMVLYTDLETPTLPVLFPNEKDEDIGSVGMALSKTDIDIDDVQRIAVTAKKRGNLVLFGYKAGDNKYTYPKYGRAKAEALIELLCRNTDYLIIDCPSLLDGNPLAACGMELADQIIRLASPDLKSISYYLSTLPMLTDTKFRPDEHIQGLNVPCGDVCMPIEEAKAHLGQLAFTVPFSRAVKMQMQCGQILAPTHDKAFEKRMEDIAQKVVEYAAG